MIDGEADFSSYEPSSRVFQQTGKTDDRLHVKRDYPEHPIIGVGAVIVQAGRVLLVRRDTEPLRGEWSVPGGMLELGEKLRDGIRREVEEETGLEVMVSSLLYVEEFYSPETRYCKFWFSARVLGGVLSVAAPEAQSEHIVAAEWLSQADLQTQKVYPSILRQQYWADRSEAVTTPRRIPLHAMEQW